MANPSHHHVHRLDQADRRGCSVTKPTGWSDDARALADHVVSVPIYGKAESLNLATAASVCLYASAFAQSGA
jgi:tRNA(Leu) C34 or U34 (ribose-2'-O)-methylase TrmL